LTTLAAEASDASDASDALLDYLRAELEAATTADLQAVLLYEIGSLRERGGDDAGAARDYLAAYQKLPEFREPLEALVALLHRRRSAKNLGRLLETLVKAARTPHERARALVERAAYLLEQQDDEGARASLARAVEDRPDDVSAWLELEVLAGRTGDEELRRRALSERAAQAEPSAWRALLLIDMAQLEAAAGEVDRAAATLAASAGLEGGARYRALGALGDLARWRGDLGGLAGALASQAELLEGALSDDARGAAAGVPRWARSPARLADTLVRAAFAAWETGEGAKAAEYLDRALAAAPEEGAVGASRLYLADRLADSEGAYRLARAMLDRGAEGPEAASLWLRLSEEAGERGDRQGAVVALGRALEADAACIPARALHVDLLTTLGGADEAAALASSLEALSEAFRTERAKGNAYLRAAWEWTVGAADPAGARAALSQATALGIDPAALARVARLLATLRGDAAWYEEATRRLIASGPGAAEAADLWLELGRLRLLRADAEGAKKAWEGLAGSGHALWLPYALDAYASEIGSAARGENRAPGPEPLDALARVEHDAAFARALGVAAARRAHAAGDLEGAASRLRALFDADPSDVLVATYLSDLTGQLGDRREAAHVLHALAGAAADRDFGTALHLEAGLSLWAAGDRQGALEPFWAAREGAPAAATPVLRWALRLADPDAVVARRRLLDLGREGAEDAAFAALSHFALESLPGGDGDEALAALAELERRGESDLGAAGALARLVWAPAFADRGAVEAALGALEKTGRVGVALASHERVRIARDVDADVGAYLRYASEWASADPSPMSGLELLAAAARAGDRVAEAEAHRLLASCLEGPMRAAEESTAALLAWLDAPYALPNPVPVAEPAAQLFNLETAPAGCDPRRRSAALRGLGRALGEGAELDALALAGWSDLARGEVAQALDAFRHVTASRPDDLAAWEGLRTAATAADDAPLAALACARLGALCADEARAAAFWEQAALLYLDVVGDEAEGEAALREAFGRDARRPAAFDRLFRRVRDRGDDDELLELIARRLETAEDSGEIVKLYWERARVLRKKGDQAGAIDALTNVTLLEPDHVGAYALSGEMQLKRGDYGEAAEAFARLATLDEAPARQRLMSAVAAADLFERRLERPDRALECLRGLREAGLASLPIYERLAALAAKTGAWEDAAGMFEDLMERRETPQGRVAAARSALAIWRDRARAPERALGAAECLLRELPGDGEALDLVARLDLEPGHRARLLDEGKRALLELVSHTALERDLVGLLARVARAGDDLSLWQACLGALVALGEEEGLVAADLAALEQRAARTPQIQISDGLIAAIGDPLDSGPLVSLFALLGPDIGAALGPSREALGVGKKERIDARSGLPLRNEVAAWAGALGLVEFELYVGGRDPYGVQGVAGEVPALVLGPGIASPLPPYARQAVARELFALRRGTTVVRTRDDVTVAAIAVAACQLADVHVEAPAFAILGEVQRQLGRVLSRKARKLLPFVCTEIARARPDVRVWAGAAQRSLDRMAALASGDASVVLADVFQAPRERLAGVARQPRAERLLRFVLSPGYLQLRASLGMGVR
jgi:Tfp pilus assembly protein PilF